MGIYHDRDRMMQKVESGESGYSKRMRNGMGLERNKEVH